MPHEDETGYGAQKGHGRGNMKCPWLHGDRVKQCAAVHGLVVISSGELEKFCESENYNECLVYKRRAHNGALISLRDYYSIYMHMKNKTHQTHRSQVFDEAGGRPTH